MERNNPSHAGKPLTTARPGNELARQDPVAAAAASLETKLHGPGGTVLFYGTTPPREGSPEAVVRSVAAKLYERIKNLPLDGLIVYDVQDESLRTSALRPFPFSRMIDSRIYSRLLGALSGKPVVNYRCIGQMTESEWRSWLDDTGNDFALRFLSVVGRPRSKSGQQHAMSLARAFEIAAAHPCGFTLGGVAIAERHSGATNESRRMLDKARTGCGFFVSQSVYNAAPTVRLLADYARECKDAGATPRRVMLTFAPCGREKTMAFVKWLGIAVPEAIERAILTAPNPLTRSIEICRANLQQILEQDYVGQLPLGVNVESLSINKDEIDASVDLFHALVEVLAKCAFSAQR